MGTKENENELRKMLFELSEEDRAKVEECTGKLMTIITEYSEHGVMALAVVGVAFEMGSEV